MNDKSNAVTIGWTALNPLDNRLVITGWIHVESIKLELNAFADMQRGISVHRTGTQS